MNHAATTHVGLGAALAIAVVLTSGHRFANDFVFDDINVIVEGEVIHDPARLFDVWTRHTMFASSADPGIQAVDTYRPVPITLFMMDAAISERSPVSYHLTNLLLHIFCTWLIFAIGRHWADRAVDAFYGALVFAVHPWAVEAHTWINGRSDPLCALFLFGGMLLLLQAETRGDRPGRYVRAIAASLAFFLALLSKETGLMAFVPIAFMPTANPTRELETATSASRRRLWGRRSVALAAVALAYLGLRTAVLGGVQTHRDGAMLAGASRNAPWLLLDTVRQLVAPTQPYLRSLRDEYALIPAWQIGLAGAAVLAILAVAFRVQHRQPLLIWSLVFSLMPMLPIAILSTVLWPGFGRYLYLPLGGFAWLLVGVLPLMREHIPRSTVRVGLAGLHVGTLAVLSWLAVRDYRDSDTLYGAAIQARPDVAMGYGWLGMARARRGEHTAAVPPLLEAAARDSETPRYLLFAGRSLLQLGHRDRARALAEQGIEHFSDRREEAPFHLLAVNSQARRDPVDAVTHLARCLEVWPGRPDCTDALRQVVAEPAGQAAFQSLTKSPPIPRNRR